MKKKNSSVVLNIWSKKILELSSKNKWWKLQNALIQIENTMQKICVHLATGNMEGTKMLGTVHIKIDFYTLWVCVKHAILVITIRYVYY